VACKKWMDEYGACGSRRLAARSACWLEQVTPLDWRAFRAVRRMDTLTGPQLAYLSRAYAAFDMQPEGLFDAIARRAVAVVDDCETQDILRCRSCRIGVPLRKCGGCTHVLPRATSNPCIRGTVTGNGVV
jgi:hypothetical protein